MRRVVEIANCRSIVDGSRGRPTAAATGLLVTALLFGCERGQVTQVATGFDFLPYARPGLSEDGTVAVAKASAVVTGSGAATTTFDLAAAGLEIESVSLGHPLRLRNGGEVVISASRSGSTPCTGSARGAYRFVVPAGTVTTLLENCPEDTTDGVVGRTIALSPNGTVAFSQIRDGKGAIWRGPSTGPVSAYRSGDGTFYNTLELDVSDSGRVAVEMEYNDGFAGGLMRGILVFDSVEQPKDSMSTAIEKLGIGVQPPVAINSLGAVAFSLNANTSIPIGGTTYAFDAGVYVSMPTTFNTPKSLTKIADLSGKYCRFGAVDINDAGTVVFEAALDGELGCAGVSNPPDFDGIFSGSDPVADAVIVRGQSRLGGHQYFDSIYLGEINNAGQVSFTTTYSEPLVDPTKVWRWDP